MISRLMLKIVRRITRWAWRAEIATCDSLVKLKELHIEDGGIELHLEQTPELAHWIGTCLASMVVASPNYTEMQFQMSPKWKGERKWITVTVQKQEGKTPHQLRQEAEKKVLALLKETSELRDLCEKNGIRV